MSEEFEAARELVERLGKHKQRNRVGLWIASRRYWGDAGNVAAQLNVDAVDFGAEFLRRLPEKARFSGLSGSKVVSLLDEIASSQGHSHCALVYNLDLLVAGIDFEERENVWRSLWQSFPYRWRALLLLMPHQADDLLPPGSKLAAWQTGERLAGEIARSR